MPNFISFFVKLYKDFIYVIFLLISFLIIFLINNNKFQKIIRQKNYTFMFLIIFISFSELFFLSNIQWSIPYRYYDNGFEKFPNTSSFFRRRWFHFGWFIRFFQILLLTTLIKLQSNTIAQMACLLKVRADNVHNR